MKVWKTVIGLAAMIIEIAFTLGGCLDDQRYAAQIAKNHDDLIRTVTIVEFEILVKE